MKNLKTLEKLIENILQDNLRARGDDDYLYCVVLNRLGISLANMTAKDFLLSYRKKGFPTLESVGRCRRKAQERLVKIQHEDYLKRHNIYEFLDMKCPVCGNLFTSYQKERFEPTFLKIECNCRKCNKSFYGFEHSDRIELWEERNFSIFSEPKYVIKVSL